jgi:hypothetical protein
LQNDHCRVILIICRKLVATSRSFLAGGILFNAAPMPSCQVVAVAVVVVAVAVVVVAVAAGAAENLIHHTSPLSLYLPSVQMRRAENMQHQCTVSVVIQ